MTLDTKGYEVRRDAWERGMVLASYLEGQRKELESAQAAAAAVTAEAQKKLDVKTASVQTAYEVAERKAAAVRAAAAQLLTEAFASAVAQANDKVALAQESVAGAERQLREHEAEMAKLGMTTVTATVSGGSTRL